jgi:uncharacterized membrane protein
MGDVDVVVEIEVAAAPAAVAAVMFDPQRDPDWMTAVTSVEVIDPALAVGARVRRNGRFMGRDLTWTTAVEAVHFPHVLALQLADGPFTGTVRYEIARTAGGSRVRIRNTGRVAGGALIPAALVEAPMRKALQADLERLKSIVESAP